MHVTEGPMGEPQCEHGTALDVHCCNCHSGFLFNPDECVCGEEPEPNDEPEFDPDFDLPEFDPDFDLDN